MLRFGQDADVLTGKGFGWAARSSAPKATGYGLVYITQFAMEDLKTSLWRCLDGIVVSFSDCPGTGLPWNVHPSTWNTTRLRTCVHITFLMFGNLSQRPCFLCLFCFSHSSDCNGNGNVPRSLMGFDVMAV